MYTEQLVHLQKFAPHSSAWIRKERQDISSWSKYHI